MSSCLNTAVTSSIESQPFPSVSVWSNTLRNFARSIDHPGLLPSAGEDANAKLRRWSAPSGLTHDGNRRLGVLLRARCACARWLACFAAGNPEAEAVPVPSLSRTHLARFQTARSSMLMVVGAVSVILLLGFLVSLRSPGGRAVICCCCAKRARRGGSYEGIPTEPKTNVGKCR